MLHEYDSRPLTATEVLPATCGLDDLWLSLPHTERFTPEAEELRRKLPWKGPIQDLRQFGLPVSIDNRSGPFAYKAPRLLKFHGTGGLDAESLLNTLRQVVLCDPLELRVYKLDLTADMFGHDVQRWRDSLTVLKKRNAAQYTSRDVETERMETGRVETLYFGSPKSNDYLRVYDKSTERRKYQGHSGEAVPSQWVRFERTFMKKEVPSQLGCLRDLLQNGSDFDPFGDIVRVHSSTDIRPETMYELDLPLKKRQNLAWARHLVMTYGRTEASRRIRAEHRKASILLAELDRAVDTLSIPMPSVTDVTARFQTSFASQMFGKAKEEE